MHETAKPQFFALLKRTLAIYERPAPTPEVLDVWWATLAPYSAEEVGRALAAHIAESRFFPVPADVALRMPRRDDNRPGAEEAWTLAIRAMDESNTVVMNDEIAQAWSAAQPVFEVGDEVGARMAFREVYARLVTSARAHGTPAKWWPSLGTDRDQRYAVLQKAVQDGLLPATAAIVTEMLPAPHTTLDLLAAPATSPNAETAIASLRGFLSDRMTAEERSKEAEHQRVLDEHYATEVRKAQLREQAETLGLTDEGFTEVKPQ